MENEKRLIDANALEKYFREKVTHLVYNTGNFCILVDHVLHTVRNAHTVDAVEVVHGRWFAHHSHCYECTCCNAKFITMRAKDWNYCPICGAKMDGDGNA